MTRFEGALVWGFTRGWENDAGGSQDVVSSSPGSSWGRRLKAHTETEWSLAVFFFFRA